MRKILFLLRKSQRNNTFYIFGCTQLICIIAYIFASKRLEKPAGLYEAGKFLFKYPDKYGLSILFGIIAWIICIGLIVSVLRELTIVKELFDESDGRVYSDYRTYEYLDDIPKPKYIVNSLVALIALILNSVLLTYLTSLLFLVFIVMMAFFIYAKLSSY